MDRRRKRLIFRANHMGMQEMDLLIGGFASAHVGDLSEELLDQFEALLEEADNDLYGWLTGKDNVPSRLDTPLFRLLLDHRDRRPVR